MFLISPSTTVPSGWESAKTIHGIVQALLEPKAHAALLGIDIEHHHLDLLAGRDDLARMHVLLGPAHLGDVDQAFHARLQLHERAVVGDVRHPAGELRPDRIFRLHTFPRVGFELLHAERNSLGLGIEADHLDIDRLADLQSVRRMVDPAPRDVGHVQQAVDAAEIDEGAVVGDVLDHAFEHLPLVQVGDQLVALLGAGVLQHGAAGDDDVPAAAVHLENLERLVGAHQGRNVAYRPNIHLASRQERHGAIEIDREAALDPAEDDPGDPLAILVSLLQLLPASSRRARSRLSDASPRAVSKRSI